MNFIPTPIADLFLIEPKVWKDNRGYFYESFSGRAFTAAGIEADFVQDNQSFSQKGTLRGLHAQKAPFAQGKLVRVIQGRVLDVAVDARKDSATYGQHYSVELSGENHKQLWVPPGFLHGFLTLEDDTIFTYKVTSYYDKDAEVGVMWNDPDLAINWSKDLAQEELLLSDKDLVLPSFKDFVSPF
ncbi:dTDP-4-dehydrorhamnose 3,5-epimerase [Pedobacter sp. MR2016-24]|uniref:dTDP-4-dehydrorhamnose 3,5-epimerase n=1 Tax=Pedobacter sp. MR2016-24 TaxID=2994466 RepID=UPI002245A336|nr:dTDP-4-dehydrorhamnose 3,5-epimerase [Pedobacter sp. MR2016-24]MCX2482280.1 dTDP-4-dehydrorhamnose 3,5-epimerase [Pedobacter sp. MR2016-24]